MKLARIASPGAAGPLTAPMSGMTSAPVTSQTAMADPRAGTRPGDTSLRRMASTYSATTTLSPESRTSQPLQLASGVLEKSRSNIAAGAVSGSPKTGESASHANHVAIAAAPPRSAATGPYYRRVANKESTEPLRSIVPMDARWRAILRGETATAWAPRLGRRAYALVPAGARCKFCNAPFTGAIAHVFRLLGYGPSRKNPDLCARCVESAPEGGCVSPLSVLFADVRDYTTIAERLSSVEVKDLLSRFYASASGALLGHEAFLAQIAGDEVMALFVPGLAGSSYRSRAVEGGRALLRAMGYGTPHGRWLDVGIGISSGEQFIGNVGGGGFKDFTSLGDVTNTAARLQAKARGDIVMDAATYSAVAGKYAGAERAEVELKGKRAPVETYRIGA